MYLFLKDLPIHDSITFGNDCSLGISVPVKRNSADEISTTEGAVKDTLNEIEAVRKKVIYCVE